MKNLRLVLLVGLLLTSHAHVTMAWGTIADIFYDAAKSGQFSKVQSLLNRGYSINETDGSGSTALCKAAADNNTKAYNLLLQYGANPYAACMNAPKKGFSVSQKYIWGGVAVIGTGAAVAAAAGGGGGGGGSSGGHNTAANNNIDSQTNNDDSENNNNNTNYDATGGTWSTGGEENPIDGYDIGDGGSWWSTDDDNENGSGGSWSTEGDEGSNQGGNEGGGSGGSWSTGDNEGGNEGGNQGDNEGGNQGGNEGGNQGDDNLQQKITYFRTNNEYNGSNFGGSGLTSVNYLDSINAAEAYAQFTDTNGHLTSPLQPVTVGVVDTGVWANHTEFMQNGTSKVSGYNYDYGPCRNDDYTNCWRIVKVKNLFSTKYRLVFSHSQNSGDVYNSDMNSDDIDNFNNWASSYPDDYDWDENKTNVTPNPYSVNGQTNSTNMHGTHVSALIAGNKNDTGMMGVAYANASIKAVRWDYKSSIEEPIKYLLSDTDNPAKVINLSMGISSTDSSYDANSITKISQINNGFVNAMRAVLNKNSITNDGYIDGIIVVKASGNNNQNNHPDVQAGIKKFNEFKDLQMLVVTAVDVTLNGEGQVTNYTLSSFANKCGITGTLGYCIAAPGGNYTNEFSNVIYSAGQPDVNGGYYATVGTSQAAPIVSGSLAFLLGAYPYMSAEEVIDLVKETANRSATDYSEEKYGAGLLDLGAAITKPIPINNSVNLATYSGNSVSSALINLDNAAIYIPASLQNSMMNAMPASITVFDRYKRPFAISTARFIHSTHGSYKTLKNDVAHIARPNQITTIQNGNFTFAMAPSSMQTQENGMGLMAVEYRNGKHHSGFYFSENTTYKTTKARAHELNNPFMAFGNAYGVHHGYDFSRHTALRFEAVTGRNNLYDGDKDFSDNGFYKQAYAINMALDIHKTKKYALTLSSGLLYEDEAMLGLNGDGAFAMRGTNTYMAGISASWQPTQHLTLSGSYYRGWTEPQTFASNIIRTSKLESSSFALEADYQSDQTTHYGLRLSSPLRVEKGSLKVDIASGRDNYSTTIYRQTYKSSLKPQKREYKLAAYWCKDLTDDVSLRTETGVRIHPEHQTGSNDYRMLLGLSWSLN